MMRARRATRTAPEPARVFSERRSERALLERAIADLAADDACVRVLEAGCGQRWSLAPDGVALHITGVDLDAEAMRLRRERSADLDVAVVADLRTVALPPDSFDVAYCSYVLEHVDGAEEVLDRLVAATRPGGRLIVRVPDGDSVYGFLVRHSPHRVHVLYKRHVEGFPDAGKPGHAPYPTVYDDVVSVRGLRAYAARSGLRVVEEYGSSAYLSPFGRLRPVVALVLRGIALMSGGALSATHNDIGMVLERGED